MFHSLILLSLAPLLLVGCGIGEDAELAAGSGATLAVPPSTEPGWRWESFGGIEVQVPQEWGGTTSGTAGYPAWCAFGRADELKPGVNRPLSLMPAIACSSDRPADSYAAGLELGTSLPVGRQELAGGWLVETVEVAGVAVAVTSQDPQQMQDVLASLRPVQDGFDAHGCPLDSELRGEGVRPAARDLPGLDEIVTVSACRYLLPSSLPDLPEPLLASALLEGSDAAALIEQVGAAPSGSGPDDDDSCAPSYRLGDELVVLRLYDGTGVQEVVVRYSGCGGHGTDDGTTTRSLTAGVLDRLLIGSLAPTTLSGVVAGLTP